MFPLALGYWAGAAFLTVIPLGVGLLVGATIAHTRRRVVALDLVALGAWLIGSTALAVRGCPANVHECNAGLSFIFLLFPLGFWIFGVHSGRWFAARRSAS